MHVNLRRYPTLGVPKTTIEASVNEELLSKLKAEGSLKSYWALWDDAGAGVSVSLFADANAAHRSTTVARQWLAQHPEFFPDRGEEYSGGCFVEVLARDSTVAALARPYILVRILEGMPATQDTQAFIEQRTLPIIVRAPGFRALYVARSDRSAETVITTTVFADKQSAQPCHGEVLGVVSEGLPTAAVTNVIEGSAVVWHSIEMPRG